ncbi:hypothetical protein BLOT_003865 [Blomia tropicalis]|nr:hypothetical protein BLOT_003865 [Blomia tropicalis]
MSISERLVDNAPIYGDGVEAWTLGPLIDDVEPAVSHWLLQYELMAVREFPFATDGLVRPNPTDICINFDYIDKIRANSIAPLCQSDCLCHRRSSLRVMIKAMIITHDSPSNRVCSELADPPDPRFSFQMLIGFHLFFLPFLSLLVQ